MKRITQKDVARELGVSHATVSFVLNFRTDVAIPASTRERVLEMAQKMGYQPNRAAQALVRGRSYAVGVRTSFDQSGVEVLSLVYQGAEARKLSVTLVGSTPTMVDAEFNWDGSKLAVLVNGRNEVMTQDQWCPDDVEKAWDFVDALYQKGA